MQSQHHPPRRIEIDLLRTLAIVMMVVYHAAFDLRAFYGWEIDVLGGGWWLLARTTATLFLLLVGASFVLSWERQTASCRGVTCHAPTRGMYAKYFRRAMLILSCAMLVTLATNLFDPTTYVRFGILHLIAISTLLLPFFVLLQEWNLLIGAVVIAIGLAIKGSVLPTSLLIPFGIMPPNFDTIDYFPLLPWFGVILIGVAAGYFLYVRWQTPSVPHAESPRWKWLTFPGRHALIIYMVHQPILLGIFAAIAKMRG